MKKRMLYIIRAIDRFTGKNRIPILYYHRINDTPKHIDPVPDTRFFHDQIKYLDQRGYHFVSLGEIIEWCSGNAGLPEKSIGITFDDGYEDNYHNAFPVLKEFGAKATIFLIYDYMGTTRYFSYNRAVPQKIMPGEFDQSRDIELKFLNKDQVLEMHRSSLVDFGSHTLSHTSLIHCDLVQAEKEVSESKRLLEDHLGISINTFCYPYGHLNDTVKEMVRKSGYRGAVATKRGKARKGDDVFDLARWNDINLLVNLPPVIRKSGKMIIL